MQNKTAVSVYLNLFENSCSEHIIPMCCNHDFSGSLPKQSPNTHSAFIMHVGVEGESTAAATTKRQLVWAENRPNPPPITRWELVTDSCERPINHRNNESGTWASGSHGTEIVASALISLIELLRLLANYQAIPITKIFIILL